ncbi:transcription antitermination protein NusB, partial [Nocardia abscessus]|uniref:transcription antitermination protein NusB n=1 Tax=Nocardia abscessus TaxID=120957 RepID=UPI0024560E47
MTPRGNRAGGDDARDRRRDERASAPKRSGESGRAQAQGGPRRDRNGAGRPPAADQRSGSGRDRDERRGSTGQRAATGRADRSSAGRPASGSKPPARQGPKVAGRPHRQAPADPPRSVARDVLRAVRERDAYANLVLPALLRERGLAGRDAALATELAYGACRSLGLLDAVIAEGAGRSIEEIDGALLDVLRLGVYQLLRTRIGAHAAVDTSVALARGGLGGGGARVGDTARRGGGARATRKEGD